MTGSSQSFAVIGDVVGSRGWADRSALQRALVDVLEEVNRHETSVQELAPTIGDEFQAVYADLGTALRATLLLRLVLPDDLDCRIGIGAGEVTIVGRSDYGLTQDGSAWWSARTAIEEAKRREGRRNKTLRSWFVAHDESVDGASGLVNAYLLARDEIVTGLAGRSRRLALGHLLGETQTALAEREEITQGAVSQNLRSSGAFALAAGVESLAGSELR
jgi:hypothetical protein